MHTLRVGMAYEPRLYADLIAQVFNGVPSVTFVEPPFSHVDVVVFSLTDAGKPDMAVLRGKTSRGAKLVAVSPRLERGLVRLPGAGRWVEVRPFGLEQIFSEVMAGRERPISLTHKVMPRLRPAVPAERRKFEWPAWLQRLPSRQWAVAFAVLVVLISFGASAVIVSARSLPGQPLYSIRRLAESVQLALAPAASKADLHAAFAQRRIEEIVALARQDVVSSEIVADLDRELSAALGGAQALPDAEQEAFLTGLTDLIQDHRDLLMEIAAQKRDKARVAQELEYVVKVLDGRRAQVQAALSKIVVVLPGLTAAPTEPPQPTGTRTSPGPTPTPRSPSQTPVFLGATLTNQPPAQNQAPVPTASATLAPPATRTQTPAPTSTRTQTPVQTTAPAPNSTSTQAPPVATTPAPAPTSSPPPPPTQAPNPTPVPNPTETREPTETPDPTETPGA